VKAFGPGLEKSKVQPGVPTNFNIDSSRTGPGSIDVDIFGNERLFQLAKYCAVKKLAAASHVSILLVRCKWEKSGGDT
jgi:hypothetical protein